MHGMSPMMAVTQVSPIAAESFPTDIEELYPLNSSQILSEPRSAEKKVQAQ